MKLIDLSISIDNETPADPPSLKPQITYLSHQDTIPRIQRFFPGLEPGDLPEGEGWAQEEVLLSTHNGTHMDAPWHYHPTMDGGARAIAIDEVPLDWCTGPGVRLDFRHLGDGTVVTPDGLQREFDRIGHDLQPGDIVFAWTRASARFGEADYVDAGCGFGRDATLFLTERGVRVVGTDCWSWDAPFSHTATRWQRERDPSIIWEGHKAGAEAAYCQIEKLTNLDQLPATGFRVFCFPVKLKGASAGWTRVVAEIPDTKE